MSSILNPRVHRPYASFLPFNHPWNFPLRPADPVYANHSTRSLSSSPGSSGRDWPVTPTTQDDLWGPVSPRTPPSPPLVKVEQEEASDGCFIIENPTISASYSNKDPAATGRLASYVSTQILAPPTEVPLRATQAPKKMKGMMGVFRINPFAMHNGSEGRGTAPTVCWEPGPLEEEPLMFEFQLDITGYPDGGSELGDQDSTISQQNMDTEFKMTDLHLFSPEFDLQDDYASKRYRSTPSSIAQVPEDQQSSPCNPALMPDDNHHSGSPFALDYRPHSSASSYAPVASGAWNGAEPNIDTPSDRYTHHMPHHHHHRDQVDASKDQDRQEYHQYQQEENTGEVDGVVESDSCSYPLMQQTFVDPDVYQRHNVALGLYVAADYARGVVVEPATTEVNMIAAHISTQTSSETSNGLRQTSRDMTPYVYEHHQYMRPGVNKNMAYGSEAGYDIEYDGHGSATYICEQDVDQVNGARFWQAQTTAPRSTTTNPFWQVQAPETGPTRSTNPFQATRSVS